MWRRSSKRKTRREIRRSNSESGSAFFFGLQDLADVIVEIARDALALFFAHPLRTGHQRPQLAGAPDPARDLFKFRVPAGPSQMGTGEVEPSCPQRSHSGSRQPYASAIRDDSISAVPHMPVWSQRELDPFQSRSPSMHIVDAPTMERFAPRMILPSPVPNNNHVPELDSEGPVAPAQFVTSAQIIHYRERIGVGHSAGPVAELFRRCRGPCTLRTGYRGEGSPMEIHPHDVLLVIDVQNDFCAGGALAVPDGDAVIPLILRLAPLFEHVVLTQDWHSAHHQSFASAHPGKRPFEQVTLSYGAQTLWPDHCIQGTRGAEFHPALHLPQAELILRKGNHPQIDSYSAFFENDRTTATGLAGYLRERGLTRVLMAGLAYDFCVGYSALDARRLGLPAVVIRDACRAIDLNGSAARMEAEFAAAGVDVAESGALLNPRIGPQ